MTSKNMKEVINVIQAASAIYGLQYDRSAIVDLLANQLSMYHAAQLQGTNPQEFTAFMDVMTKQMPKQSRKEIAQSFRNPVAKQYLALGDKFETILTSNLPSVKTAQELISKGVDPNFSWGPNSSLLGFAIDQAYTELLAYVPSSRLSRIGDGKKKNLIAIVKLLLDNGARPDTWLSKQMKFFKKNIVEQRLEDDMKLYNLIAPYAEK